MVNPAEPFRVLVTGSRTWKDRKRLCDALEWTLHEHNSIVVIHGHNPDGADAMAHEWATGMANSLFVDVSVDPHPADWNKHGKAAGPIRNAEMVKLGADVCLAFLTPGCKGTVNCAALAQRAGIPVTPFFSLT